MQIENKDVATDTQLNLFEVGGGGGGWGGGGGGGGGGGDFLDRESSIYDTIDNC